MGGLVLRRLAPDDLEPAFEYARAALRPERFPDLLFSPERTRAILNHFINGADFHLAAFDDGKIVGGIAVMVAPMLWFERCDAHVVFFHASRPGVGVRLFRAFERWAADDMRIRRIAWAAANDMDKRVARWASRMGFEPSWMFVKTKGH